MRFPEALFLFCIWFAIGSVLSYGIIRIVKERAWERPDSTPQFETRQYDGHLIIYDNWYDTFIHHPDCPCGKEVK